MSDDDLDRRMRAVERLVELFRLERMVHVGVTSIALLMLLVSAGMLIFQARGNPTTLVPELGLMFGASGLISYSAGRLLNMFNQAMSLIVPTAKIASNDHS